ncbi:MAG: hypothetical protein R3B09_32240 [Nannocystaceae bacterium]
MLHDPFLFTIEEDAPTEVRTRARPWPRPAEDPGRRRFAASGEIGETDGEALRLILGEHLIYLNQRGPNVIIKRG